MNKKAKFNILAFNDAQINDELIDALIKAGAHEYIENKNLSIPDSEISDIEFSEELDKRIRHDIADYKRQTRKPKFNKIYDKAKKIIIRAAAVILIMLIAASGFVITSDAAQEQLLKLYLEHSSIDTSMVFKDKENKELLNEDSLFSIQDIMMYIPIGLELINEDHQPDVRSAHFESLDGEYLDIMQMTGGNLKVNSEDAKNYTIEINGYMCFFSEHEDMIITIFETKKYGYSIITSLPIHEVIEIIENIKD
ncbi:MAG: DUF4367 domain-containing protein [Clostridia bacterium]|nr:DUF4367 domain-containing protein [Clostridia bacterium]